MTTSGFGQGGTNNRRRVASITITNPGAGYTSPPTISFSRGTAAATATLGVGYVALGSGGSGYVGAPPVTFSGGGGGSGAAATASVSASVASVTVTNGGSGYASAPTVSFSGGGGSGAAATAAISPTGTLTIYALGDKRVLNHAYSGPNATAAPFNNKLITRHYGFGSQSSGAQCTTGQSCVALVGSDGVLRPLTSVTWSDTQITGGVPANLPNCTIQQRGQPTARCGELYIRAANGKESIDTVTVTIGGKAPTRVLQTTVTPAPTLDTDTAFGRLEPSPLQTAIDNAQPGDLIIVGPGAYRDNLLMWKPVRLQGVGAESVTINADAHPAGKMDAWRRQVNCLFGLSLEGRPLLDDGQGIPGTGETYDPSGTYTCPPSMQQRVDRIPFETIIGWDTTGNGNLAQMLQEPTLMGAYEGAGITVLARGVRIPANSSDFWGSTNAGGFPAGYQYLTGGTTDCTSFGGTIGGTGPMRASPMVATTARRTSCATRRASMASASSTARRAAARSSPTPGTTTWRCPTTACATTTGR